MKSPEQKPTKISFANRLTPKENHATGTKVPSVDEIKIGQVFFATEAGRTTIR